MTPDPASWELRSAASGNHSNVRLASLATVDKLKSQSESLPQRAEQPSAGGIMAAYPSKNSAERTFPPLWSPCSTRLRGVDPFANGSVDEEYGQIL